MEFSDPLKMYNKILFHFSPGLPHKSCASANHTSATQINYAIMHLVSTQICFVSILPAGGHISCFVRAHLQRWYNSESRCGSPSLSCSHSSTSCSSSSQPYTFFSPFSPVTFHFFEFLTFFFLSQSSTGPYFFLPSCLLVTSVLHSANHVHV